MKRTFSLLFMALAAAGCSGQGGASHASLPHFDYVEDSITLAREAYYYQYSLPFDQKKSDGSYVEYDDVVAPYRYGTFSECEVLFITYSDPENPLGRTDASPYEPAKANHHGIEIEFVGHKGWPYVFKKGIYNSYRPDNDPYRDNGGRAGNVFCELLEFKEALTLGRFTDEDLVQIAKSAEAIRNDPSLWHWTNEE